jgi:hypothetical protein
MATGLPTLLPPKAIPRPPLAPHLEWTPRKYLSEPQPPPQDEGKIQEQELANARQVMDGKVIKKTRPRRTVDYNGGMGRWALVSIRFEGKLREAELREAVEEIATKSHICTPHQTKSTVYR